MGPYEVRRAFPIDEKHEMVVKCVKYIYLKHFGIKEHAIEIPNMLKNRKKCH